MLCTTGPQRRQRKAVKRGSFAVRRESKRDFNLKLVNLLACVWPTDTEPPRFRHCPSNMQIISGKKWSKVVLPPSYHTDNVGVTVFSTSIRNGSNLTWGEYKITYAASDKAGNTANCSLYISIAGEYIFISMQVK